MVALVLTNSTPNKGAQAGLCTNTLSTCSSDGKVLVDYIVATVSFASLTDEKASMKHLSPKKKLPKDKAYS